MQVNLAVNIRDNFWEVVQWPLYTGRPLYTGPLYTGSTVVRIILMRSQRASVRTVEVDRSRVNEKKFNLMFYALTPYVLCYIL